MKTIEASVRPTPIRIGFVPLVDAAPLIVAVEGGFFADEGLRVELHREIGWGNVRDKLVFGALHLSHALLGMAPLSCLDAANFPERLTSIVSLGGGGNAITFGQPLTMAGVRTAAALARRLGQLKGTARPPLIAHVFGCSMHHYLLRDWLSAGGVNPDTDVRLCVLPPPQMPRQLALQHLAGFCVGEPWNTLAESQGVGSIVAWTSQWMPTHPEKVLATSRHWLASNAGAATAIIRAVLRACEFCEDAANRGRLAAMLCKRQYLDAAEAEIVRSLAAGPTEVGAKARSWAARDTFPSGSAVLWLLGQMRRWKHLTDDFDATEIAKKAVDSTAYRKAAETLNIKVPETDFPPLQIRGGWFEATKTKHAQQNAAQLTPTRRSRAALTDISRQGV